MPNPRLVLAAGFVLIVTTTIWFGLSATSLSQSSIIKVGDNQRCPPAITVLASTCDSTYTATLYSYEFSTVIRERTSTIAVEAQATPAAVNTPVAHSNENAEGYPIDHDDDELHHSPPQQDPSAPHAGGWTEPHDNDDQIKSPTKPESNAPAASNKGGLGVDEDSAPLTSPTTDGPESPTEEEHPVLSPSDDENFNLTEVLSEYTCYPASEKEAKQIALDTLPSVKFNVVRGDNIVLNRKPKTAGENFKTWRSVGRKPDSGCWTYNDRFGKYDEGLPRFLRSLGSLNTCKKELKKALVVHLAKGQSWNMRFTRHLRSLITEAGWVAGYHIYILTFVDGPKTEQDEYLKDVIPEPFRPLVKTFNNEDLQAFLGSDVPFEKYEGNSHVAVQKFMHDNPQYEFVYFVDSQTRYTGRWDMLLKNVEEEYAFHRELKGEEQEMPQWPDLVTFEATREPGEDWETLDWACMQYFKGDKDEGSRIRRSLGAMGGFSKRMAEALTEINGQKINCHSDYFPPTVAAHKDLTTFFYQHPLYTSGESIPEGVTATSSGNDAITVQQENIPVDFSYSSDAKDAQEYWQEWASNAELCRPEALLHPVSENF